MGLVMLPYSPFSGLLIFAAIFTGITLMVGYFKHSRGTLDSKHFSALWITTAIYNFVFLLPVLYWTATIYQQMTSEGLNNSNEVFAFFIAIAVVLAYVAAIFLSLKACSIERYKKLL
jgi:uncharacterized membrane protein HdeD (DUF308 family)